MDEEQYTDADLIAMQDDEMEERYGAPPMRDKEGIWTFFKKIIGMRDSSKVANLNEEEMNAVRLMQQTSNYADSWTLDAVADYIKKDGEIILATSDSKSGFLVSTAVTSKKHVETKSGYQKAERRSRWFKKNVESQEA